MSLHLDRGQVPGALGASRDVALLVVLTVLHAVLPLSPRDSTDSHVLALTPTYAPCTTIWPANVARVACRRPIAVPRAAKSLALDIAHRVVPRPLTTSQPVAWTDMGLMRLAPTTPETDDFASENWRR